MCLGMRMRGCALCIRLPVINRENEGRLRPVSLI